MSSSSPELIGLASTIPKIGDLRKLLGFTDQSSPSSKIFNDKLRAFRREYKTADGLAGVDLHDWKSQEHQKELTLMVRSFLSNNNDGKDFWPGDQDTNNSQPSDGSSRNLSYHDDESFIKRTLKQLIFRLNQQEFRNIKYKRKNTINKHPVPQHSASRTDPIHVEAEDHASAPASMPSTRQSTAVPEDTVDEMLRDQSNIGTTLNSTNGLHRSNNTKDQIHYDGMLAQDLALNEYLAAFERIDNKSGSSTARSKRSTLASKEDESPPSKRQKVQEDHASRKSQEFPNTPSSSTPEQSPEKRTSGRIRNKPNNPSFVTLEEEIRAGRVSIDSPIPAPTSIPWRPVSDSRGRSHVSSGKKELDPRRRNPSEDTLAAPRPSSSSLGNNDVVLDDEPQQEPSGVQASDGSPSEGGAKKAQLAKNLAPTATPSPSQASPIKIIYIVKSHSGAVENVLWRPSNGRFLDKSLQQVMQELPKPQAKLSQPTRLRFRLSLLDDDNDDSLPPDKQLPRWTVELEDEQGFSFVKTRLDRQIKGMLASTTVRPLELQMQIEVLYPEEVKMEQEPGIGVEESVLDW